MACCPDPAVRKRWHTLLRQHSQYGLSIAQFCRRQGCSTAAFYLWRRRLAGQPAAQAPTALLPVTLVHVRPQQDHFRVRLASGAVIEIPAVQTDALLQLVDHLECHAEASQP